MVPQVQEAVPPQQLLPQRHGLQGEVREEEGVVPQVQVEVQERELVEVQLQV